MSNLTGLLIWGVAEAICSLAKKTPFWLAQQILAPIARSWRELSYLRNLVHDERFAQWRPRTRRYVALRTVKAQVGGGLDTRQMGNSEPRPLIDSLQE